MRAQKTRLVHYDPTKPITLTADASSYGIGAVISQCAPDGTEQPITFASKTLPSTEKNYSQVENEALSVIFGVRKFHQYLSGRHFQLTNDHKPLLAIFSPEKSLPVMTLQRLQRWALIMIGYDYHIVYRKSDDHANADALSRLPIGSVPNFDKDESIVGIDNEANMLDSHVILNLPLSAKTVADYTRKDPILSKVLHFVTNGWPTTWPHNQDKNKVRTYLNAQTEITSKDGVLLRDSRVIIPTALRARVLNMLHLTHIGIVCMKSLARMCYEISRVHSRSGVWQLSRQNYRPQIRFPRCVSSAFLTDTFSIIAQVNEQNTRRHFQVFFLNTIQHTCQCSCNISQTQ